MLGIFYFYSLNKNEMEYMIFIGLFLLGLVVGRAHTKITNHMKYLSDKRIKDIESDFEGLRKEVELIKSNQHGFIGISNNLPELLNQIEKAKK